MDLHRTPYLKLMLGLGLGLSLLAGSSWAQPPRPAHDRPLLDSSFWGVMRDVHKKSFSSRLEFTALLSHDSVRAEVGLDTDEYQQIQRLNLELIESIKKIQETQLQNPVPHDQVVDAIVAQVESHEGQFIDSLRGAADFDRFLGILVQARGTRAVVHEEIAKRIDLPRDKLDELRELSQRAWREQMEELGDNIKELLRQGQNRETIRQRQNPTVRALFARAEEKVNRAISLKLTSDQLNALNQMKGEPFELPDNLFDVQLPRGFMPGSRGPRPGGGEGPRSPR